MLPLIKNNCQIILARKIMIFMLLILPVILFSLGLLNVTSQNAKMNIGVVDHDNTLLSETLTAILSEDGSNVQDVDEGDIDDHLLEGKVRRWLQSQRALRRISCKRTSPISRSAP